MTFFFYLKVEQIEANVKEVEFVWAGRHVIRLKWQINIFQFTN